MTLIRPDDDNGAVRDILLGIEQHLDDAIGVFRKAINDMRSGADTGSPEFKKDIREMRSAYFLLLQEKSKIDAEIRNQKGIVYDFAVDFKAARAEVRRRMARLRDTADPG